MTSNRRQRCAAVTVLLIVAVAAGIAADRLEAAGPKEPTGDEQVAFLAGGCFWGMEQLIRELDGVVDTEVGYAGGTTSGVTYADIRKGDTGHAETVRVVFDPNRLSYADLLRFYFRIHDPTTRNRQGNDVGSQYRSVILVVDDAQREVATRVRAEVEASGFWKRPLVTDISTVGPFSVAEEYHQDYLVKNPGGYTCHFIRGD